MSQFYIDKSVAPPIIPPEVAEQFTTDAATGGTVAIPSANNLNLLSRETTANNLNGIQTVADPDTSDNLYVELTNRATGAIGTMDATPTTIITFPLGASPAVFTLDGLISGLNNTVPSGGSYFFTAGARTNGTVATLIGVEFTSEFEETGMAASDVNITVAANNLIIQVIGIAATAIDWLAQFTYSRVV